MLTMRKLMMTAACVVVPFAATAQAQLPNKSVQIVDKLPPKATGIFSTAATAKIGMAWEAV
jgi:hypothetical protein